MKGFIKNLNREIKGHYRGSGRRGLLSLVSLLFVVAYYSAYILSDILIVNKPPVIFADSVSGQLLWFCAAFTVLLALITPASLRSDAGGEISGGCYKDAIRYGHSRGGLLLGKYFMSVIICLKTAIPAVIAAGAISVYANRAVFDHINCLVLAGFFVMGLLLMLMLYLAGSVSGAAAFFRSVPPLIFAGAFIAAVFFAGIKPEVFTDIRAMLFFVSAGAVCLIAVYIFTYTAFCGGIKKYQRAANI